MKGFRHTMTRRKVPWQDKGEGMPRFARHDIPHVTPRASLVTPSVSEERVVTPSPSFVIPSEEAVSQLLQRGEYRKFLRKKISESVERCHKNSE